MRHLVYFLATALIASISFTSCQRKAITQEEIDELNRQISEKLAMVKNNDDTTTSITIDTASTDSTIKINTPKNDKKTEITIIQGHNDGGNLGIVLVIFTALIIPFVPSVRHSGQIRNHGNRSHLLYIPCRSVYFRHFLKRFSTQPRGGCRQ